MHMLLHAACIAALLGLTLVAVGAFFGRAHPLLDLFGQFLLPATAGAAAVAFVAVLIAEYQTAVLSAVVLAANLAIAWPWLQAPAPVETSGPRFTLMVFNVFFYNPRLDLAVKLARKSKADIVVLLEVIERNRPGLAALEAEYPYRFECWQSPRCDSLIFSRFPLTAIPPQLPVPPHHKALGGATAEIEGRTLTLFTAHLILPFPFTRLDVQPTQAADIAEKVAATTGTRLLVGDFNAATWGASVDVIRERAGLSVLTGSGGSWPTFLPKGLGIPIDHVLATPDLMLMSRELRTVYGSDHRAVIAEIAFKN